jgi:ankyrin repeat protein
MKTRWKVAIVLAALIAAGATWFDHYSAHITTFLNAAYSGETSVVSKMLDDGQDVNAADPKFGATALIYAAQQGHTDTVKLLLDHHADIDGESKLRQNALEQAAFNNHLDTVKLLLERGAKLDDWHRPSVMKAVAGDPEIMKLLPPAETPAAKIP